jgi:hypothetical protein
MRATRDEHNREKEKHEQMRLDENTIISLKK